MTTTTLPLPSPSKAHATCAWCERGFSTIVALLDHVDVAHVAVDTAPRPLRHHMQQAA